MAKITIQERKKVLKIIRVYSFFKLHTMKKKEYAFIIFKPCVGDRCDNCSRHLCRVTVVQKGKGFKNSKSIFLL